MAACTPVLLAILLALHQLEPSGGSSHWIVTEDGRVQAQLDTVYSLRRPYDLVAFMRQEERAHMLHDLKDELLSRKDEIDRNEDRDTGLEQKFYKTDPDCLKAGKPLPEFDLYISTVLPLENKGIRPEEHIDMELLPTSIPVEPNCEQFTDLDFSMHAFEHLEGMRDRATLSGTPEMGLKNAITYQDNVDEYGHRVYEAMRKNSTSWVLYNMAAFFWRIKGDPYRTIECVRRALHYSPRNQKDVALISLANVLHRARYSNEAAVVVHAALDVSKELNVNHFTLGNIYAVMAEYNKSVICFENTLKIQPDFKAAAERKYAVKCHAKLEAALEAQHRSLQRTLNDLKDYQKKHDYWQQQSEKMAVEQVSTETKLSQQMLYESLKVKESSSEIGEYCRMSERDGKQVLMCTWGKKVTDDDDFNMFQGSKAEMNNDSLEQKPVEEEVPIIDYSKPVRPPLYTKENKIEVPKPLYAQPENDWPGKEECDTYVQKVPDPRNLSTVYLSPENKGFEVKALLTEAQNLQRGDEHPLPWYPPVCVPLMEIPEGRKETYDHIKSITYDERVRIPLKLVDSSMTEILMSHVEEGISIEELGQRLLTALKQKIGPGWVLYNLAGLYWRIIGNNYHGIECIRRSLHLVPAEYKDVPLTNLANILFKWGRYEDAVKVMQDAIMIGELEPDVHLFYGNLLWATKNYTGAVKHYEKSLDILPENQDTFNTLRAIKCFIKFHQTTQSVAQKESGTPAGPNCPQRSTSNGNGGKNGQETESRVICKNENGEEKCVIETRSRSKAENCNGQCTQTCTVTPIKLDGCATDTDPILSLGSDQCSQKGPSQPYPNSAGSEEPIFNGEFSTQLDEVSEHYLRKGVCQGEECSQLRVQCLVPMTTGSGLIAHVVTPPKLFIRPVSLHTSQSQCMDFTILTDEFGRGKLYISSALHLTVEKVEEVLNQMGKIRGGQKPHIKLDFVNGVLHQKLIFVQSTSELPIEPHECVIFNDGTKSVGCNRPEYKSYLADISSRKDNFEQVELILMEHLNQGLGTNAQPVCQTKCQCGNDEEPKGPSQSKLEKRLEKSRPAEPDGSDGKQREPMPVEQLPDSELPDTNFHIGRRYHMATPTLEECQSMNKIDFSEFTSTFLSVTAKGIDLRKHIDFETVIKRNLEEPICITEFESRLSLDSLPGVQNKDRLNFYPEIGLKEVLQKLGGDYQPVDVMGTRIAQALKKNMTSWVLANTAALYWRVEGDARRAIDCLRLSLTTAPKDAQDTSFISVANILHRSGYTNDAIVTTNMAMEMPNKLVVSHFTMANLYAAKGIWNQATMFYESTLGLQSTFEPAKQRLKSIKCRIVMQKPEIFQ